MKNILKVIVLIFMVITLSACSSSKEITKETLEERLSSLNFVTRDATKEINDSSISKAIVADNNKIQIEFYIFKSKDSASKAYESNKESFAADKDYKVKESKHRNYTKSVQKTKNFYNVVIKSDDMVIYSSVNINYKKDVKKALRKMGY